MCYPEGSFFNNWYSIHNNALPGYGFYYRFGCASRFSGSGYSALGIFLTRLLFYFMITEISNSKFLGNTVNDWVMALIILVATVAAVLVLKRIVIARLKKMSQRTDNTFDDFLVQAAEARLVPLMLIAAFYYSIRALVLPAQVEKVLNVAFSVSVTWFVIRLITASIKYFVFSFLRTKEDSETKEKQVKGILLILNIVIWVVGFIFLIDNLGYKVSTLLAGLGIGGIAIALAAQTILGDLFSYFVIFFDRPFELGDFIIVNDKMGVVEYVGIKTTRIRALSGEQIICSNTFLTNSRVHNYKRMEERRIVFNLGVVYQTTHEQLKKIPGMVKDIISAQDLVRFDRGHFSGFGDFSLNFEFVFYVASADYNIYMDKQQAIFLDIVEAFAGEQIEFAYPTQTLFVAPNSVDRSAQGVLARSD